MSENSKKAQLSDGHRKTLLYNRIFKAGQIKPTPQEKEFIDILEKEFMVFKKNGIVYLNGICEDPSYKRQLEKNQRIYKTIVSLIKFTKDGKTYIVKRHFFPLHQEINLAKYNFFKFYPELQVIEENDDDAFVMIQYTNSFERTVSTVYESKTF